MKQIVSFLSVFLLGLTSSEIHGTPERTCQNGIQNSEGTVCCSSECGSCGGVGCEAHPAGATHCCVGAILRSSLSCGDADAPCILSTPPDPACENGILNHENDVCCSDECGSCGGDGCHLLPGGAKNCCMRLIKESGLRCDEAGAPCIFDEDGDGETLPCNPPSNVPILPGSPFYESCRQLFNPRLDFFPAAIIFVENAQNVSQAVSYGKKNNLALRVRSGGHSYEGFSVQSDGLVIDVGRMNAITFSDGNQNVVIQSGVQLLDAYEASWDKGVGIAGGSCSTVGIAGLTTGGGLGLEMRLYGLTIDRLTRVQIVTPDEEIRDVTQEDDELLYWATRGGGGGNFGVVTEFEFNTFPVDMVTIFQIQYSWTAANMQQLITTWQNFLTDSTFPDELFQNMYLASQERGAFFSSGQCYCDPDQVTSLLNQRGFLEFGNATFRKAPQSVTWIEAKRFFAGVPLEGEEELGTYMDARRGYPVIQDQDSESDKFSSVMLKEPLDSDGIDSIISFLGSENSAGGSSETAILIDSWGGQITALEPMDTAFFYRNTFASAQILACYPLDSDDLVESDVFNWVESFRTSLLPFGDGAYRNYCDNGITDWPQRYYGENYPRLQQAKATYDPQNWFRYPQSIQLPDTSSGSTT